MSIDPMEPASPHTALGEEDDLLAPPRNPDPALISLVEPGSSLPGPAPGASAPVTDFVAYYGFGTNPFPDSVNPGFFYQTDSHGHALKRMTAAVEHNVSLAMVTGPSGTGKTLVTQLLLQQLEGERFLPVLILVSPGLSKTGLLREMLSELNVALPAGVNRTRDLLKLLSNTIIDLYREGRRLVMIVDECHFLSADNLHLLRTISNLEIPECKLTTCLLFGEERFARRLEHPSYESLRNRMFMRCELGPMGQADTEQYVKFRCLIAGRPEPLFTPEAMDQLHEATQGICRSINKICMLAMMEGAGQRQQVIDGPTVRAAIELA